jgi:hypothetical protein
MNLIALINPIQWASGIILLFLAGYVFRFRELILSRALFIFLLLTSLWCLLSALTNLAGDINLKILLNRFRLLAPLLLPTSIFYLSVTLNGDIKISRFLKFIIISVPCFFSILILSPWHQLFITDYEIFKLGPLMILKFHNGAFFFIHNWISRILVLVSLFMIGSGSKSLHSFHRKTRWIIIGSILIPFLVDSMAVIYFENFRYLQLVPVSLGITSIFIVYALFIHGSLRVIPYARSQIVSFIKDPCLMWNIEGKLVDCNLSATRLFNINNTLSDFEQKTLNSKINIKNEYDSNDGRTFTIQNQDVRDENGSFIGSFSLFNEITSQKAIEQELKNLNSIKTNILSVLSHDLVGHIGQLGFLAETLKTEHKKLSYAEQEALSGGIFNLTKDLGVFVNDLLEWSKRQYSDWTINNEEIRVSVFNSGKHRFLNLSV